MSHDPQNSVSRSTRTSTRIFGLSHQKRGSCQLTEVRVCPKRARESCEIQNGVRLTAEYFFVHMCDKFYVWAQHLVTAVPYSNHQDEVSVVLLQQTREIIPQRMCHICGNFHRNRLPKLLLSF
jgi:hypothetical protein